MPQFIEIRGARVNNLKNIDVNIPLGKVIGICGVSGSGDSSLALGVLYSEGFRKYLSVLSAYLKRRIAQQKKRMLAHHYLVLNIVPENLLTVLPKLPLNNTLDGYMNLEV
jgi:excinuclease UvrABC ATPase subunit